MNNYFNHITEFVSIVIAIVYYDRIRHSFSRWFLPFLIFIFAGEMVASNVKFENNNNIPIYYIISIGESVFYGFLFYRFSKHRWLKNFIAVISVFNLVMYLNGFLFYRHDYKYYLFWLIASGFFFAVVSLLYLYEKFNSDDELNKHPGFWVALGVTVFFSGSSVVFSLHDLIAQHNLRLFGVKLYRIIPQILSLFLYSCISVSIILHKNMPVQQAQR